MRIAEALEARIVLGVPLMPIARQQLQHVERERGCSQFLDL